MMVRRDDEDVDTAVLRERFDAFVVESRVDRTRLHEKLESVTKQIETASHEISQMNNMMKGGSIVARVFGWLVVVGSGALWTIYTWFSPRVH